jgi:predicted DNA-binding transcriptional regulator AlpA
MMRKRVGMHYTDFFRQLGISRQWFYVLVQSGAVPPPPRRGRTVLWTSDYLAQVQQAHYQWLSRRERVPEESPAALDELPT